MKRVTKKEIMKLPLEMGDKILVKYKRYGKARELAGTYRGYGMTDLYVATVNSGESIPICGITNIHRIKNQLRRILLDKEGLHIALVYSQRLEISLLYSRG